MSQGDNLINVIEHMQSVIEDSFTSKVVKDTLQKVIADLEKADDKSIAINRAVSALEDLNDDMNIDPMVRTELVQLISELEQC